MLHGASAGIEPFAEGVAPTAEVEDEDLVRRVELRSHADYLRFYETALKEREQRALTMVESEGRPYVIASRELGTSVDNFKMVICRARKKVRREFDRLMEDVVEKDSGTLEAARPLQAVAC